MKYLFLAVLFACSLSAGASAPAFNENDKATVLVIPYNPAMHLSDADIDIATGSDLDMQQMRSTLRVGLIKELNKNFAEVYNVQHLQSDFVKDYGDDEVLYHTLLYESDSVYPKKYPARFAVKDTSTAKKTWKPETKYINVQINDDGLFTDLLKKYNSDYFIFLNEIDIKTNFDDCMNLALKIYRRDLKVHYSIFDKNGKQVYGDVAVSHFASSSNDVNEIMKNNFPQISGYILQSLERATK